jgi:hypothetical protein
MSKRPAPLFLARQTYRRRRMMDAARLLPLVGIFAFLLPILWQPMTTPEPDTAFGMAYLFGAWALLIVAARVMAGLIMPASGSETPEDEDETL